MPLISVFTPTYNRADKIHRVFNSLLAQTFKDFEWIIVDDGSTDKTFDIISHFRNSSPFFKIHYSFQENSGKHIAINKGICIASGKWFHIADSDDEIEPTTLKVFIDTWDTISEDKKAEFCGIVACCKDQFGKRVSDKVPHGVYDGHLREMFYKLNFRKEYFHIYQTSIMKLFPFPLIYKCYFPEAIIWKQLTENYKVRVIPDELRIYYRDEDENTLMSRTGKSPKSKALSNCLESSYILNNELNYFRYYPKYFLKMSMVYHSFRPFLSTSEVKLVPLKMKALIFSSFCMFPGFIYARILQFRFNKNNS